jgi:hypothetical protein
MRPYPLSLQLGMTRYHGHLFIAPWRLYFVCGKQGGVLLAAIGQSIGGAVGGLMIGLGTKTPGEAPQVIDEGMLVQAVAANPGSFIMEPAKIQLIKQSIWRRTIRYDGKVYGLTHGLDKDIKAELGGWCKHHSVPHKGLG